MSNLVNSISERKFFFIMILIILYIVFNFFGGDRGLIEYFKKKILLKVNFDLSLVFYFLIKM